MTIKIDNKNVRDSGSVVILEDAPTRFDLGSGFVVIVKFVHDESRTEKMRRAQVVNNELVITFTNYDGTLGTTNASLMSLGTIGDKRIYLNYAVWYIGDSEKHSRVLHYTFLDEKVEP